MNIEELINKNQLLEDENKTLKEKLKNYTALLIGYILIA
jgi:cell division septum initiation protein DivIVA